MIPKKKYPHHHPSYVKRKLASPSIHANVHHDAKMLPWIQKVKLQPATDNLEWVKNTWPLQQQQPATFLCNDGNSQQQQPTAQVSKKWFNVSIERNTYFQLRFIFLCVSVSECNLYLELHKFSLRIFLKEEFGCVRIKHNNCVSWLWLDKTDGGHTTCWLKASS